VRAGQEGRPPVTSAAIYARSPAPGRRGPDDRLADGQRCAPTPAAGADLPRSGCSRTRATPGRRWSAPPWKRFARPGRPGVRGCGVVLLPDRLARKSPTAAADRGVRPRPGCGWSSSRARVRYPEDQLLVQFRACSRIRESPADGALPPRKATAPLGSVNVLSGAPFATYLPQKSDHAGAAYQIIGRGRAGGEFRRYADDGASIATGRC